jgi:hypothetical protein
MLGHILPVTWLPGFCTAIVFGLGWARVRRQWRRREWSIRGDNDLAAYIRREEARGRTFR